MATDRRRLNDLADALGIKKTQPRLGAANGRFIPARVGEGLPATSTGDGIASPLTETARTVQQGEVSDAAGLVTFYVDQAVQITMLDAEGREVVLVYTDPEPTQL